jgi:hypothetical protein
MKDFKQKAKDLFLQALEKGTPAEREAFLAQACAGDAACHFINSSQLRLL